MKFGKEAKQFYIDRQKEIIKEEAILSYKDKLKAWLSMSIEELKETPLYNILISKYPDISKDATLAELRIIKLFEKVFVESSQKALELSFKLDGSMDDLRVKISYDDLNEAIKEIE